ncbi:GGDEF domain-containing protein [Stenotrophomonas sp. YIM B06876]|uniref:GGDEF domain-containing protein n=1 Tax=Stenotrophomonas sp. YIM B06876 TaxID=3060211 RepID=UPI00273A551B|nr:GGDEF domain-containing protein [Stenotrophomonas sp. YIM B06876]
MSTMETACVDESSVAATAMAEIVHAVLSPAELALFAQFGRSRQFAAGEVLFLRGDHGQCMYIVVSGIADLDFGEDLVVKYLGPNEFFGELGLLIGDHRRSADARAATELEVLELRPADFQRLIDHDPGLVAYFLRRTIMRVVSSEQRLIGQLRRRNHDLEAALDNLYSTTHQLSHTQALVRTDELTGLSNRRGLTLTLQQAHRSGRHPQGLLLIDCDRFKRINDEHGHLAGDRVLQSVANILRSVAKEEDVACRLGGDEFCLLVAQTDAASLDRIAAFILGAVQGLRERQSEAPRICSISIGVCLLDPGGTWNDWYSRADGALYEAKRLGGNRLHWYSVSDPTPD